MCEIIVPGCSLGGLMSTILILEDNPDSRYVLRSALEQRGHTVLEAFEEAQAVAFCEHIEQGIDLLIADVVLRSRDGPTTARHIARVRPGLPILFVSGHPLDTLLNRGLLESSDLSGRAAFLRKPFLLTSLLQTVDELMTSTRGHGAEAADREPPASREEGRGAVLVIDTEPAVRELMANVFEYAGYVVLLAASTTDAVGLLEPYRDQISLILAGLNETDATGLLGQIRSDAKVIFGDEYRPMISAWAGGTIDETRSRLDKSSSMSDLIETLFNRAEQARLHSGRAKN